MLNKLWPIFIIVSCGYALIIGKVQELNNSIFSSVAEAVELTIIFIGTISLWNGIMKIACETSLIKRIVKILKPIIKKTFPEIKENSQVSEEISMNIVANVMGLGNAATPLGLKAMTSLQEENKEKNKLSNSMAMLIVLNTASLQIIPTTVIAIRQSLNSQNPTGMLIPIWISSSITVITVVIASKIFIKRGK